jgi:hypothetical protein
MEGRPHWRDRDLGRSEDLGLRRVDAGGLGGPARPDRRARPLRPPTRENATFGWHSHAVSKLASAAFHPTSEVAYRSHLDTNRPGPDDQPMSRCPA